MFSKKILSHPAVRYLFTGGTAFVADYLTLVLLYQVFGVSLFLATSAGFAVGFAISFSSNRHWVFGGTHNKKMVRQMVEYLLLAVFNYFFTVQAVTFLNHHGIKPYVGKIFVMGFVMVWNYAIFKWVIFTHQKPDAPVVS